MHFMCVHVQLWFQVHRPSAAERRAFFTPKICEQLSPVAHSFWKNATLLYESILTCLSVHARKLLEMPLLLMVICHSLQKFKIVSYLEQSGWVPYQERYKFTYAYNICAICTQKILYDKCKDSAISLSKKLAHTHIVTLFDAQTFCF